MDGLLPEGFRFGVATAAFQVEGHMNGPDEPRNNWWDWERTGRVEPSGIALDFWNGYEEHLDRAAAMGCDAFRMSIEWARCEPEEGVYDEAAFARYRQILAACRDRGMEPLVTLHHFTHPWWLGQDLWLEGDSPARFARWVEAAVDRLADSAREWVTINELNILALQTWLTGDFPPARWLALDEVVRALDHLLAAHVLAYDAIKVRQADSVVSTNAFTFSVYELDRLLTDVLVARAHGVERDQLGRWLAGRRADFHATVDGVIGRERIWRRWAAAKIPMERALPATVEAVYASPHQCTLDVVQLDHYQPSVAGHVRLPGHRTAGGRGWLPATALWDDQPDPSLMSALFDPGTVPGRDLWIVENGLCNRVRRGRSYPRLDGWTRPRYLRAHLREVVKMVDAGVPVTGYYHWSLVDNYEWGSYEPRFGLHGVDRERGLRWLDTDSMGNDAAGAYRRLIEGLRAGDRSVVGL
ncbi:family 1 glycosylhydrolase [soil metagenome]